MANTQATKEAIWITKLMMDLGYMEEKKMIVIRCDNQGAISVENNKIRGEIAHSIGHSKTRDHTSM